VQVVEANSKAGIEQAVETRLPVENPYALLRESGSDSAQTAADRFSTYLDTVQGRASGW